MVVKSVMEGFGASSCDNVGMAGQLLGVLLVAIPATTRHQLQQASYMQLSCGCPSYVQPPQQPLSTAECPSASYGDAILNSGSLPSKSMLEVEGVMVVGSCSSFNALTFTTWRRGSHWRDWRQQFKQLHPIAEDRHDHIQGSSMWIDPALQLNVQLDLIEDSMHHERRSNGMVAMLAFHLHFATLPNQS